jgi:hypothetical protein
MFIGIFPFESFAASPFDEKKLLEKLSKLKKNEQVIIVTTDYAKARNGKLVFYQKENGKKYFPISM